MKGEKAMINEEAKMIENGDITHAIDSLHEALLFARLGTYANKDSYIDTEVTTCAFQEIVRKIETAEWLLRHTSIFS